MSGAADAALLAEQFIDYMLTQFYAANLDWGTNKNWYLFRRRAPGEEARR